MKSEIIFDQDDHKWIVLGRDDEKRDEVIDTNEYIIVSKGEAILLDPGGIEIFPQVLTEMTRYVDIDNIKLIFASHQDPDISSSLSMWLDLCPNVKVYCSWIWKGYISHFGMGTNLILNDIPDEGMELFIGSSSAPVYFVPAHFCHSSGNFSVYDPKSEILFSGDIGAALLPDNNQPLFVENFNEHIKYMEGFHKRWMPSSAALRQWVKRVREISPKIIAPQHGSIFKGEDVDKFLNWIENLDVAQTKTGDETGFSDANWLKWKK